MSTILILCWIVLLKAEQHDAYQTSAHLKRWQKESRRKTWLLVHSSRSPREGVDTTPTLKRLERQVISDSTSCKRLVDTFLPKVSHLFSLCFPSEKIHQPNHLKVWFLSCCPLKNHGLSLCRPCRCILFRHEFQEHRSTEKQNGHLTTATANNSTRLYCVYLEKLCRIRTAI